MLLDLATNECIAFYFIFVFIFLDFVLRTGPALDFATNDHWAIYFILFYF